MIKGSTNRISNFIYKISRSTGSFFDKMTYRPFKGGHRGYWYRLPWNKGKFFVFLLLFIPSLIYAGQVEVPIAEDDSITSSVVIGSIPDVLYSQEEDYLIVTFSPNCTSESNAFALYRVGLGEEFPYNRLDPDYDFGNSPEIFIDSAMLSDVPYVFNFGRYGDGQYMATAQCSGSGVRYYWALTYYSTSTDDVILDVGRSIGLGIGILLTLMFLISIGFIWNSLSSKKPWH